MRCSVGGDTLLRMTDTTTVVCLGLDELWLLQQYIRHEVQGGREWEAPPASHDLNDRIAGSILMLEETSEAEAAFELTFRDCLAIDCTVPASAKDVDGKPIGRKILLKTFEARRQLQLKFGATNEVDRQFTPEMALAVRQQIWQGYRWKENR